jgi:GntR family transcriptional regulator
MIDRSSPIPLYYQIAMDFRERLMRQEWNPGERIPSEIELSQEYQVSRETLRQGLAYLEDEGILSRHRGRGTFVERAEKRTAFGQIYPLSFGRQMRALGYSTRVELVRAEILSPINAELSRQLALDTKEEVVSFERLFFANDDPVALIRSRLPHRLCPGLIDADLINHSLAQTLNEKYDLQAVQVDQWLTAARLQKGDAALLNIESGSAGLAIQTRSQAADGTIIEYAETICIENRISLHIQVSSRGETNLPHIEYVALKT